MGRRVDARATPGLVEVFCAGELVKTHVRARKGGKRTDWGDFPPEKVAFLQRTPAWCRSQASQAGEHVGRLVGELLAGNALHHLRAAQGVLRLGERYGTDRLDAACQRALTVGDPSYRTVKGILAAGTEHAPLAIQPRLPMAQIPALLHGAAALTGDLPAPASHHDDPDPDHDRKGVAG